MNIRVLYGLCRSCDVCVAVCPGLALRMEGSRIRWQAQRCHDTGACLRVCPARALIREPHSAETGPSRG